MSNTSDVYMVKLIRGASFTTPGMKFIPGNAVPVTDPKLLEVLKRSQLFKITKGDDVEDDAPDGDAPDDSESESGEPTPKKKKRKRS